MKRISKSVITTELCSYGCGNVAKFLNGSGNLMCRERHNYCPALIKKNSDGLKKSHKEGNHPGTSVISKERKGWKSGKFTADFSYGGKGSHKKVLILERGHICESCNLQMWLNKPITLELDHIDGDSFNNVKTNLKLLCPNCHSQTPTWKRGSKKKPKVSCGTKVSDDELRHALKTHKNIREALLAVGLTGKGYIYSRCYKLLSDDIISGSGEIGETQETQNLPH